MFKDASFGAELFAITVSCFRIVPRQHDIVMLETQVFDLGIAATCIKRGADKDS